MRKLAILLALALALSACLLALSACGDDGDTSSAASTDSSAASDTSNASSTANSSTASTATSSTASSTASTDSSAASSAASSADSSTSSAASSEASSAPEKNPNAVATNGENVALGKTYTTSPLYRQGTDYKWSDSADITYPDTDDKELTDGKFPADDATYGSPEFMGFAASCPDYEANKYASVTVDLGEVYALSKLSLYVGTSKFGAGIAAPATVEFFVSEDGTNFVSVGKANYKDDKSVPVVAATLECDVTGRNVQARMTSAGWMFVCELEAS